MHGQPPLQVNWQALWLTWQQRDLRAFLTRPLMALLILIPVGIFAGGLQQLDYLFCPTHKCYVQVGCCASRHQYVLKAMHLLSEFAQPSLPRLLPLDVPAWS